MNICVFGIAVTMRAMSAFADDSFWKENTCVGKSLDPRQRLSPGMHLCEDDYIFGLEKAGVFAAWIDYSKKGVEQIWFPKTKFFKASFLEMQKDGNLVVYGENREVIWASDTSGNSGARLSLSDGVVRITKSASTIWRNDLRDRDNENTGDKRAFDGTKLTCIPQPLHSNERLEKGEYLCHGRFWFGMDLEGDLSIWNREAGWEFKKVWSAGTSGESYAVMQQDGNLVVYRFDGKVLWASGTYRSKGAKLFFDNGIAYINRRSGKTVWSHNNVAPPRRKDISYDEDDFDIGNVNCITPVRNEHRMARGDYLCEGVYYFGVDESGDLSMWEEIDLNYRKIWSARTSGDVRATKQKDGNLVVYRNGDNQVLWNSNTEIFNYAELVLRGGTAKLISQSGSVVWTTNYE